MAFTIRQLQYFVAVAEKGTVSGAAQNLSISQSSVTEAIKELESDLGVELFERHPRGLNITHKGHQFLRHATKILADVSDAAAFSRRPRGRLAAAARRDLAGGRLRAVRPARPLPPRLSRRRRLGDRGQWRLSRASAGRRRTRRRRHGHLQPARPHGAAGRNPRGLALSAVAAARPSPRRRRKHRHRGCRARAADHAHRRRDRGEHRQAAGAALGARPHVAFRTRSVEAVRSAGRHRRGPRAPARPRLPPLSPPPPPPPPRDRMPPLPPACAAMAFPRRQFRRVAGTCGAQTVDLARRSPRARRDLASFRRIARAAYPQGPQSAQRGSCRRRARRPFGRAGPSGTRSPPPATLRLPNLRPPLGSAARRAGPRPRAARRARSRVPHAIGRAGRHRRGRSCPLSTGPGRWKATASSRRDISGALPVVQVGMVWRRGSGLPQTARDFIGIAQSQRGIRQR